MYYLQKNALLKESYDATEEIRKNALETLADASDGLIFEPDEHRYFLGGREMRSVSSIVEHYAPFDKVAVATRCSLNPKHEHYGKSVEEIIAIWEEDGRIAAEEGTRLHAFGEACFLYMTGHETEIEDDNKDRVTEQGLQAISPKEESIARWWAENDWRRFTPIAKETRIVNVALGYAGTFDLLLYDLYNFCFVDKDYKSNKDLDRWFGEMCLPPLSMLKRNDIGKYTIQQTAYTIQLRNLGLPINGNTLIWLRENGYEERHLSLDYDKVVEYAIRTYMQSLN